MKHVSISRLEEHDDCLDRRLEAIERAKIDAELWRKEGRFRPILILLAIILIGGGASIYFGVKAEAEKRKTTEMQLQGEKTREALRQADAWRRTAIAGQFQHLLVNADKALNEGKQDRARALALAAHEIMTAQDTTASGGIAYKNSLLASLPSNLRELYAFQGKSVSSDVVARYSENGNVIAWTDKRDRNVNLTDASTGRLVKQFQRTTSRICSLSFSQNATQLALVSNGRQIELFDLDKGRLNEANGVLSSARVDAVAFGESVQGAILVGVSENGLRAWRLNPVVVELTSDAPPSESGGHKSTSSSASAVDCARTRCAYFDGSRLYIYEVDEVIRQIAIGANITTELKQDGDEDRSQLS